MFRKIFGAKKPAAATPALEPITSGNNDNSSPALKIIHAGGIVEPYYMAVPATSIIDKINPSCVLARPEVFRRPWDSIVAPEETLLPGQKYFVVPSGTLKKLTRRIRRPTSSLHDSTCQSSIISAPSAKLLCYPNDDQGTHASSNSSSFVPRTRFGILIKSHNRMRSTRNRRVRFFDAENNPQSSSFSTEKDTNGKKSFAKTGQNPEQVVNKGRSTVAWHPTLTSVTES